jgi:tRNA (guanine-N7-)-methyltransferase
MTENEVKNNSEIISKKQPKKRFFRTRAHCNPLSHNDGFEYPPSADLCNWEIHYPKISSNERIVRHLDIGIFIYLLF